MIPRLIYSLLYALVFPAVLVRMAMRARRSPDYARRLGERFSVLPSSVRLSLCCAHARHRPVIWVHAVSVGETVAAVPVVNALMKKHPDWQFLITTMTPTGSAQVRHSFGERVLHVYAPYDLPWLMQRFVGLVRPELLVIMETELWPNLIHQVKRAGGRILLLNGRLSEKSAAGYQRVRWLAQPMLRELDALCVQTDVHARRFEALGAAPARVRVTGSVKFDVHIEESVLCRGKALRERVGRERPVWIGASTHEGEDDVLLRVHEVLRKTWPELLLVLVPRHPERFDAVCDLVRQRGFESVRKSTLDAIPLGEQGNAPIIEAVRRSSVLVGDTMGQLPEMYAAADMAFVGGSLVPVGGHNPIEPASLGLPIVMGRHVFNFDEICHALAEYGGLRFVDDERALIEQLSGWLSHPKTREICGQAGQDFVNKNRGAVSLCCQVIERHMF